MQKCRICDHPQRRLIEATLLEGRSLRACESLFAVSKDSLHRHWQNHLRREPVAAAEAVAVDGQEKSADQQRKNNDTAEAAAVDVTPEMEWNYLTLLDLWRHDPGLLKRSQILSRFGDRFDSATIESLLRRAVASGDLYEIPLLDAFLPTAQLRLSFLMKRDTANC